MNTNSQRLINGLNSLSEETIEFTRTFVKIKREFFPHDNIISISGDYSFEKLSDAGCLAQDKIYKKFIRLVEIISILLVDSPEKHLTNFKESTDKIKALFLHESLTWLDNTDKVIVEIVRAYDEIKRIINILYPNSLLEPLVIPDTNALYQNIQIEEWQFNEFNRFSIVITPSVLSDLDKHKIEHRNEEVRKKALTLINKLKEYRRRGKLTEGITITKDRITLISIAKEPDFSKTLSWLDKLNDDDRLIAEYIEIVRMHGNQPVFLVTSDINLQNKCEIADILFFEPPSSSSIGTKA